MFSRKYFGHVLTKDLKSQTSKILGIISGSVINDLFPHWIWGKLLGDAEILRQDELQDASRVEGEAANHIPIGLRGSCYGNVDHVEHSIHTCVHASCTARAKQ